MALYKYVTIETLGKILGGTIRFTQPGAFNDPFEMVPELCVPEHLSGTTVTHNFSVTAPRSTPQAPTRLADDLSSDEYSRQIRKQLDQQIGILCLSRNPSSLLMWAHYAASYSGAVVEFDETHEFFDGIIDVLYQPTRPRVHVNSYIDRTIPIADLCVKSDEWSYESEVRVARGLSDCRMVSNDQPYPIFVMDLPQECISAIVLGERTPIKSQKAVYAAIYDTIIPLSLAAIPNWGYEFRTSPIKLNKPFSELSPIMDARTAHIFDDFPGHTGEIARWMIENHRLHDTLNETL